MNSKKRLLIALYALYITFILISCASYIGEESMRGKINNDQYSYKLTYEKDGIQSHYDVIRTDSGENGYITVLYTESSNTVDVKTVNIRSLVIDCRSIAEEKSIEVLGQDYYEDTNAYKKYFIDKGVLNVKVDADHEIRLTMKDVPYPENVIVNQNEFIDYTYSDGTVTTIVPMGFSDVDVYFSSSAPTAPTASISVARKVIELNDALTWDGSQSTDSDGTIEDYIWDFGDGTFAGGVTTQHQFTVEGVYRVYLTVRDNDGLIGTASKTLTVLRAGEDNDRDGMADAWEDYFDIDNPYEDPDEDGLDNIEEFENGTFPTDDDTDDDGIPDGWEVINGIDPTVPDANSDPDNDGYNNFVEYQKNTDPLDKDSQPPEDEEDVWNDYLMPGIIIILIVVVIVGAVGLRFRKTQEGPIVVKPYDVIAWKVEKTVRQKLKEERKRQVTPSDTTCPACRAKISSKDASCPKCGFNILHWKQVSSKLSRDDMPITATKVVTRKIKEN